MTGQVGKTDVRDIPRGFPPIGETLGRDASAVAVSRIPSAGAVLMVLLGGGVGLALAQEDLWNRGGWGLPQSTYIGSTGADGLAAPMERGSGQGWRDPGSFRESTGPLDGPSWGYGDLSAPATNLGFYGDQSGPAPHVWGPVGSPGATPYLSAGAAAGLADSPPIWQGGWGKGSGPPMDQNGPPRDTGVPFWGVGPGPEGYRTPLVGGYGAGVRDLYPGYRFRGDPPAVGGPWQSGSYESGYRFRPLTDQERMRIGEGPGLRPAYPPGFMGSNRHSDPLPRPETSYGFEPSPRWTR